MNLNGIFFNICGKKSLDGRALKGLISSHITWYILGLRYTSSTAFVHAEDVI